MLWHRVYLCIELPLYFDHVLLIPLGNQIYSKAYLPESTAPPDPMQVGATLSGEIEVDDNVDRGNIDAPGDEIGTDQCLELSLSKPFEDVDPLLPWDLGMQVLVLVFLLVELLGEHLRTLVRLAEDDALVDDERAVDLEDGSHLLLLVHQHVVMGEADKHQLVHQVDHLRSRHELLLEGTDPDGEGGRVHQQGAFGAEVVHNFLDVFLEITLEEAICLVQHEELALRQQIIVLLDNILQSPGCAHDHMNDLILYLRVILLDHGSSDEEFDIDLLKLRYFLS